GFGDAVDRFEQLRRALAGQGRQVQDRGVVEELHLAAQLLVELLREVGPPPLHQVPLVGDDDHAAAGLSASPAMVASWSVAPSTESITRMAISACSIARRAITTLTDSTWPARATRPGRRIPAVSMMRNRRLCH